MLKHILEADMKLMKIKEACLGGFRNGYINPDQIVFISAGDEPDTTVIETTSRNIFLEMKVEEFLECLDNIDLQASWKK